MFATLEQVGKTLEQVVSELDPDVLDGDAARRLTGEFSRLERLAGAGKALCAGRVASSGAWKASGEKSPARWMARETGTSVGRALSVLETAQSLRELPEVDKAVRTAAVSESQAVEITPAASASPRSQSELLEAAQHESVQELKQRCAKVKAAATPDERPAVRADSLATPPAALDRPPGSVSPGRLDDPRRRSKSALGPGALPGEPCKAGPATRSARAA